MHDRELTACVSRPDTVACHQASAERVILAMRSNLEDPFSLKAMARVALASPYHFNRIFRQITGIPPTRFLYALRLDAARRLLLSTDERVTDICYQTGYNSLGTFTRRFHSLIGVSPNALRALARSSAPHAIALESLHSHPSYGNSERTLTGCVTAPQDFTGRIFVGLFREAIPEGEPVACAIASQFGLYGIDDVPDGDYFLFSVALSLAGSSEEHFQCSSALRAGGQAIRVRNGTPRGDTHLLLRPPKPFDPPILMTLPVLMRKLRTVDAVCTAQAGG